MADNLTFGINNKIYEVKKQLQDELRNIEYLETREEAKRRELELEEEEWNNKMQDLYDYLEQKKKVEEEIKNMKQAMYEEQRKYWDQLEEKKRREEEEERKAIEKYRRFENVTNSITSRITAAKEILQAAENAYFNKNINLARELLDKALAKLDEAINIAKENSDILKEYDSFEWILDGIEAIKDAIEAKKLAWSGKNPTSKVRDATTKTAKSYYRRTLDRAKKYNYYIRPSISDPSTLELVVRDYQEEIKWKALLDTLTQTMDGLAEIYQVTQDERSPLRIETIMNLRPVSYTHLKLPTN